MLKCKICNFKTESQISLSKHTSFHHKLKFPDYLIQVEYKGVTPICKCGCGEVVNYDPKNACFYNFLKAHHTKLEGHWGNLKSEKRVNAIIKTRKEKFASGEYNHIIKAVKGRDNIALGNKISKTKKENPYLFSNEQKKKQSERMMGNKHSQETKDKMKKSAIDNIMKKGKVKCSKLEYKFKGLLELENIKHIHSYYIKDGDFRKIYDFYLPEYNILIEVDGDFWHYNPKTQNNINKYKAQIINIENDQIKNKWALDNGYKLLRFWESDINNNIIEVKKTLLENCKKALSKD